MTLVMGYLLAASERDGGCGSSHGFNRGPKLVQVYIRQRYDSSAYRRPHSASATFQHSHQPLGTFHTAFLFPHALAATIPIHRVTAQVQLRTGAVLFFCKTLML